MSTISIEEMDQSLNRQLLKLVSLEDSLSGLASIHGRLVEKGICRSDAQYLQQIDPDLLPSHLPLNAFTTSPSQTNYSAALEAIDIKRTGLIAALIAAVAAAIYKVYQWISGRSPSGHSPIGNVSEKTEAATIKINEKIDDIQKSISDASDPSKAKQSAEAVFLEELKSDRFKDAASELMDEMMHPDSKILKQFKFMSTELIPKVHDLIKLIIKHYNDLAARPTIPNYNQPQHHVEANVSHAMLDKSVQDALGYVNTELDKLGLNSGGVPPGQRNSLSTANQAAQIYRELQRLHVAPSTEHQKLTIDKVKSLVNDSKIAELYSNLDTLTQRVAGPIADGKVEDLLNAEIKWPEEIKSDPEKLKKAERVFTAYRELIKDCASTVSKLYLSMGYAGNKYVEYLQIIQSALSHVQKSISQEN